MSFESSLRQSERNGSKDRNFLHRYCKGDSHAHGIHKLQRVNRNYFSPDSPHDRLHKHLTKSVVAKYSAFSNAEIPHGFYVNCLFSNNF